MKHSENDMNPCVGYKRARGSVTRYAFIYPEREAYMNRMWTGFDRDLQARIEVAANGFPVVAHLDQETGKPTPFAKSMAGIFAGNKLFHKAVDRGWPDFFDLGFAPSVLREILGGATKCWLAPLNEENKPRLFAAGGLGCRWIIFILRGESGVSLLSDRLGRHDGMHSDDFFARHPSVAAVLCRNYSGNSVSALSNTAAISRHIEQYLSDRKIFMSDNPSPTVGQLSNIFYDPMCYD